MNSPLATWHRLVETRDASGLNDLVADDATFHSPVVHTPQRGRTSTVWYLTAAFDVFFNERFRYVREIVGPSDAMLEFETEIDAIVVNGIDLMRWNTDGLITDFKVMLRPRKALDVVQRRMAAVLEATPKGA